MNDLTIFTPTFNRVDQLKILYESLKKQSLCNFTWLIIDDGSSDGTKNYIEEIQNDCKDFPIKYFYKENEGKHIAYNFALSKMESKWHVVVDSDDWLYEKAVERFFVDIERIEKDDTYVGIVYPRVSKKKEITWLPNNLEKVNIPDIKLKYGLNIETCIVINNSYMKAYEFPKYKDEKFLGEECLYIYLSQIGFFLPVKCSVYGYRYLNNGWTNNIFSIWKSNPLSTFYSLGIRKKYIQLNYRGMTKLRELIKVHLNIESLKLATSKNIADYFRREKKSLINLIFFPATYMWTRKRF